MADSLQWWYEYHKEDYNSVKERLRICRTVMMHGRKDAAVDMLEKSCVNAVLSIQTAKDRHERAFTMYYGAGVSLERACSETVYGNQKADWLHQSLSGVNFEKVVEILRENGHMKAHAYLVEHFKGLSWVKAAFALTMVGVWELACPDSRTKDILGIEERINTYDDYQMAVQQIDEKLDIDEPLFIKQWVMYDYKEQEHARHMPFYREVLPAY